MSLRIVVALALCACSSDLRCQTQVFAAPSTCAQGPFDVDVPADGTTAVDGIELVACTPRRLVGHAEIWIGSTAEMTTFGDVADNARCVAGSATAIAAGAASGSAAPSGDGSAGSASAPVLVKQVFQGSDGDDATTICASYGGSAQEIADYEVTRTSADLRVEAGEAMNVRLWSVEPNDLDGVVFLIRHVTSTKPPKQLSKDEVAKLEHNRAAKTARLAKEAAEQPRSAAPTAPQPTDTPWKAPPLPLAEARPDQPSTSATWVPGYWKWTGVAYGWVAGFWRDPLAIDMPAPRVEMPGDAPRGNAIWIAGGWRRAGGSWVWIGGRWRAR